MDWGCSVLPRELSGAIEQWTNTLGFPSAAPGPVIPDLPAAPPTKAVHRPAERGRMARGRDYSQCQITGAADSRVVTYISTCFEYILLIPFFLHTSATGCRRRPISCSLGPPCYSIQDVLLPVFVSTNALSFPETTLGQSQCLR